VIDLLITRILCSALYSNALESCAPSRASRRIREHPNTFTQSILLSNIQTARKFPRDGPALGRIETLLERRLRVQACFLIAATGDHPEWRPSGNSQMRVGGADRDRTGDPLLAKQVLSQLSYSPKSAKGSATRATLAAAPWPPVHAG